MNLSTAGTIASNSLGTISKEISVISRNISNAHSQGYSAKSVQRVTGDSGAAEIAGIIRMADSVLFKSQLRAISGQANSWSISDGLAQIAQFMNLSSGSATDSVNSSSPAAFISKFATALQQYDASPSSATAGTAVLSAAQNLTQSLNDATTTTQQLRLKADQDIDASTAEINTILGRFQQVNSAIVFGAAAKADISDMLDERDSLLAALSSQLGISTVVRPNNDMVIYTDSGVTLFETTPRSVSFQPNPALGAGAAGNAVYVDGVQVTGRAGSASNIRSGALAGLTQLRDVVAPQFQSQLDEIARGLVVAFAESDQTGSGAPDSPGLFTFPVASGVPGAVAVAGLAGVIKINPNADPNQGGDVSRIRDGGISSPSNPAYVYNTTGAAGYSARIEQLISALSSPQLFDPGVGLNANMSVTSYATSSDGWLAAQKQQADNLTTYQSAMLNQSTEALSNSTGVNLDSQMAKMLDLENSYQATAKLLAMVDSIYSILFDSIRP